MNDFLRISIKFDGDILKLEREPKRIILERYGRQFHPNRVVVTGGRSVSVFCGKYRIPLDLSSYSEQNESEVELELVLPVREMK